MQILVTRPLQDAKDTASKLLLKGIEPVVFPLLEVASLPEGLTQLKSLIEEPLQAVILTSVNAARLILESINPSEKTLFLCSGDRAASLLIDRGYRHVMSAGKDSLSLVSMIQRECQPSAGALLYVSAREVSHDIVGMLEDVGYEVQSVSIYANQEVVPTEDSVLQLKRTRLDGVLLFSPSAARAFVRLVEDHGLASMSKWLTAYCISQVVASCLEGLPLAHIKVALMPTEESTLSLLPRTD